MSICTYADKSVIMKTIAFVYKCITINTYANIPMVIKTVEELTSV